MVFDGDGSYVENKGAGSKPKTREEARTYVVDLWVKKGEDKGMTATATFLPSGNYQMGLLGEGNVKSSRVKKLDIHDLCCDWSGFGRMFWISVKKPNLNNHW